MGDSTRAKMRQVVDWSAAIWAGLISGLAFFLLNLFVTPLVVGGNAWVMVRLLASVPLGRGVLAPPATFDAKIFIVALASHFLLAIVFSLVLAIVIHRWGLVVGVLAGAAFGLALYFINFYSMTLLFPWFFAMRSWTLLLTHVVFGAVAGGVYEALEVEEFVPA